VIVLDTSFLVAFHNSRDVHHGAATGPMAEIVGGRFGPALLPEYVRPGIGAAGRVSRRLPGA
jgi:predicted nucleic acid-binding protein